MKRVLRLTTSVLLSAVLATPLVAQDSGPALAIRGAKIVTLAGPEIASGTVVIENGLIAAVGPNVTVPDGANVIDAAGLEVYPGLFDAISPLGLTEVGAVDVTVDRRELGDYNPHLLALTAVHPASEHIPVARANGITHTVATPSGRPGGIGGQGSLIHMDGWTVEEMLIAPSVGMVLEWPTLQTRRFDFATRSTTERSFREAKQEYDEQIEELEGWLRAARQYAHAVASGTAAERDLKLEAVGMVTSGELPFLITAGSEREIGDALEFAKRNEVRIVIVGGREAWKVADRLAESGVPVILGPTQDLPRSQDDGYDQMYAQPGQLYAAGVKIAFATFDASSSRTLPYEAGSAVSFGLPREAALEAITINAAEMLGVGDRLGTIEVGKIANIIVTDGDPLEIQTQVRHLIINGRLTSADNKHQSLYEKYRSRPRP